MDKKTLVGARREAVKAAEDFLKVLDKNDVPVRSYFWYREPLDRSDEDEWRLVVASPLVDKEGPSSFYRILDKYLRNFPARDSIEDALTTASPASALVNAFSSAHHFVTSSSSTAPIEMADGIVYRLVPGDFRGRATRQRVDSRASR